jgi:hypothetical protein
MHKVGRVTIIVVQVGVKIVVQVGSSGGLLESGKKGRMG